MGSWHGLLCQTAMPHTGSTLSQDTVHLASLGTDGLIGGMVSPGSVALVLRRQKPGEQELHDSLSHRSAQPSRCIRFAQ